MQVFSLKYMFSYLMMRHMSHPSIKLVMTERLALSNYIHDKNNDLTIIQICSGKDITHIIL